MMKGFVIALAAGSLIAAVASAPAGAQRAPVAENPWAGVPDNPRDRIEFLQQRIDRGIANRSLDRREADKVSHDLDNLRQWVRQMHWEDGRGLTREQHMRVQARLDDVSREIHALRHNQY